MPEWLQVEQAQSIETSISQVNGTVAEITELMKFTKEELTGQDTQVDQSPIRKDILDKLNAISKEVSVLNKNLESGPEKAMAELTVGKLELLRLKVLEYLAKEQHQNKFPKAKIKQYHHAPIFVRELQEGLSESFEQLWQTEVEDLNQKQQESLQAYLLFLIQNQQLINQEIETLRSNVEVRIPQLELTSDISTRAKTLADALLNRYQTMSNQKKKHLITYFAPYFDQLSSKVIQLNLSKAREVEVTI